jgi:hypothetical protein
VRISSRLNEIAIAGATAAALAGMVATAAPAEARDGWNGAIAGGAAAGIIGGLAVGAMLNSHPRPVYVEPAPVYVGPRYVPECHVERRRVWLSPYDYTYRRVEICD